jgi:hypothetical protein
MFWSLTLLSRSKTKSILPCNFEELTYVAHVFLPHVIYENVDIVFIGIYNKHVSYPLSILKEIFLKSNSFQFKVSLIRSITNKQEHN